MLVLVCFCSCTCSCSRPCSCSCFRFQILFCYLFKLGFVYASLLTDRMRVRLMNGASKSEGVVQLQYFGIWVPTCGDHGWDIRDARVVCHEMGYGEAIIGYNPASDSMEEAPSGYDDVSNDRDKTKSIITIDRVRCFGNETSIAKCRYEVQFNQRCHIGATVTCHTPRPGKCHFCATVTCNTPRPGKCHIGATITCNTPRPGKCHIGATITCHTPRPGKCHIGVTITVSYSKTW